MRHFNAKIPEIAILFSCGLNEKKIAYMPERPAKMWKRCNATYLKKFLVVDKNLAKPTISWFFSKVLTFWGVFGSRKNCL